MTRVKVCGLTRFEDCEAALDAGADALGFVLDPTSHRKVADGSLALMVGPYAMCFSVYGEFVPDTAICPWVQCSGGNPRAPFVRAVRLGAESTLQTALDQVSREPGAPSAILLDAFDASVAGGSGRQVDWGLAAELVQALPLPVILAGGLGPENVVEAIRKVRPYGVDASSALEIAPGIKDPARVREFVRRAKDA